MHTDQTLSALSPWRAALYIRLSRDDGDKPESNSVTNQREILKEHLKLRPDITIYDIYIYTIFKKVIVFTTIWCFSHC